MNHVFGGWTRRECKAENQKGKPFRVFSLFPVVSPPPSLCFPGHSFCLEIYCKPSFKGLERKKTGAKALGREEVRDSTVYPSILIAWLQVAIS